eukprot:TRINITY_DN3096_c0_g1_i1.p1 TRINITY_DN3096_c0_g1~~TRINITY_DN3096_c0_g1_i1.p1  ORF type:complete len:740 (+),score=195.83 TRINITY_DN3096_c0_g1_i1:123-2222(+)
MDDDLFDEDDSPEPSNPPPKPPMMDEKQYNFQLQIESRLELDPVAQKSVCAVCHHLSTDPVSFTKCNHCVCGSGCIDKCIINVDSEFSLIKCPLCEDSFLPLKDNLVNEHLLAVVDRIRARMMNKDEEEKETQKEMVCGECGNPAFIYCNDCQSFLCKPCHEKIHSMRVFRGHQFSPVDVSLNEEYQLDPVVDDLLLSPEIEKDLSTFHLHDYMADRTCKKHPECSLAYYCPRCCLLVCSECIKEEHSQHNCMDIVSASNVIIEEFKEQLISVENLNISVRRYLRQLMDIEHELDNQLITRTQSIRRDIERLRLLLTFREAELLAELQHDVFGRYKTNDHEFNQYLGNLTLITSALQASRVANERRRAGDFFNFVYGFTILNECLQGLSVGEGVVKGEIIREIIKDVSMAKPETSTDVPARLDSQNLVQEILAYQTGSAQLNATLVKFGIAKPHSFESLSGEHASQLMMWLGAEREWKLIFDAKTHGFGSSDFHTNCDNKGPTVTLVFTPNGAIFGAYTPVSWTILNDARADPSKESFIFSLARPGALHLEEQPPSLSTLFQGKNKTKRINYIKTPQRTPQRNAPITTPQKVKKELDKNSFEMQEFLNSGFKLPIRQAKSAVFHRSSHGPCFGGSDQDHDLYICHNAHLNGGYTQLGISYSYPPRNMYQNQRGAQYFLTQSHHFEVSNYQVYALEKEMS